MKKAFPDVKVDLIKGSRGAFTVTVDGNEVWNKHETGDFPNEDQLVSSLKGG